LLAVGLLAVAATLPADDWTGFRGPGGKGVSHGKDLPVKWGPTENIRWKVDLPGRGLSNPVIVKGKVFVTASSGYRERRLHVLCFDEATGKKLWERQFTSTGSTACHPMTCMAAPTPACDAKGVYALFATGDLAALDHDGNLLWYRSMVGDYPNLTNQVGMAASPVLVGNTLLLPLENVGDSFAAGINIKTGKNRWRVKRESDINWCTPVVFEQNGKKTALFLTSKAATAFDPEKGTIRWTYPVEGLSSIPSAAVGDGVLFLPGGFPGDGNLHAVKPRQDGSQPELLWKTGKLKSGYASPVFYKGRLYGLSGVAFNCVNPEDGEVIWTQRINGKFDGSPIAADGKIYITNEDGVTTVFEAGAKAKVLATNKLYDKAKVDDRNKILATPAIAGGAIFLRSDKQLFCIGPKKVK
jgi:outer membrane protein assembly factor BamB